MTRKKLIIGIAIPYSGSYFRSSTIEKDIHIDFGENYETIDPRISMT